MAIKNALASVAVKNISSATKWYEKLLGRSPDSKPMQGVCEWEFEGGGWLQVYEGEERAGSSSVTLAVDNMSEQISALKKLNLNPGTPSITEKVKTLMIKDLDGNSIAFAEAIDPTMAK
ncbi:hypothetical protein GCM10011613_02110 [Cellvibrio zantedeschiae]|uniref:VOC domain-containing protein n=1 Tax=Cellvibrio zantedeschiae TaxID=1237077 RepID=A0ABQ3ANH1_9GAMM|nr:VOC family protein [Cellvibrio zantedeschiae]GGY62230.1 hypothetical protein GCM10011613_02110 [Cellvibrio zantedeschiae]